VQGCIAACCLVFLVNAIVEYCGGNPFLPHPGNVRSVNRAIDERVAQRAADTIQFVKEHRHLTARLQEFLAIGESDGLYCTSEDVARAAELQSLLENDLRLHHTIMTMALLEKLSVVPDKSMHVHEGAGSVEDFYDYTTVISGKRIRSLASAELDRRRGG
jgi:hypothetical protein